MKIKIDEIDLHLFANFSEIFYEVKSGMIVGGACSGKTSILNAISAAFINTDINGSKIGANAINNDANVSWAKIYYHLDDQEKICHRTWVRTMTGASSTSTVKIREKDLFLAVLNPLWIFSLPNGDREYVIMKHVFGNNDFDVAKIVGDDVSEIVADIIDSIGETNLASIKKLEDGLKEDIKCLNNNLDRQIVISELFESIDRPEDKESSDKKIAEFKDDIETIKNWMDAVKIIKSSLYKKSIEKIEKHLIDTKLNDNGSVSWCEKPEKMLSKNEMIHCGLEIANAIAADAEIVPPTVVEDAISYDLIDINEYPNLSQLISTNFADVPLAELNGKVLHGIEQKTSVIPKNHVFIRAEIEEMEIIE